MLKGGHINKLKYWVYVDNPNEAQLDTSLDLGSGRGRRSMGELSVTAAVVMSGTNYRSQYS